VKPFKGSVVLKKTTLLNMLANEDHVFRSKVSESMKWHSLGATRALGQILVEDVDDYNHNRMMQSILWGDSYGLLRLCDLYRAVFEYKLWHENERCPVCGFPVNPQIRAAETGYNYCSHECALTHVKNVWKEEMCL